MAVEGMARRRRGGAGSARREPHGDGFELLGRDAEVSCLSGQIERLRGGQGSVLLLEGAPGIIAIDDLQWCDAGTLLALRTLTAELSAHPILWLVTVRTGSSGVVVRATVDGLADAGARTIRLGRLPEDAVAQLRGRHVPAHRYGSARHVLDHLSPLARSVLRTASVLGRDLLLQKCGIPN